MMRSIGFRIFCVSIAVLFFFESAFSTAFIGDTQSSGLHKKSYGGAFGYQSDGDSGLMLLGSRYYDPSTGRFFSRDSAKDGSNWYVYCGNNPLKFADPTGNVAFLLAPTVAKTMFGLIGFGVAALAAWLYYGSATGRIPLPQLPPLPDDAKKERPAGPRVDPSPPDDPLVPAYRMGDRKESNEYWSFENPLNDPDYKKHHGIREKWQPGGRPIWKGYLKKSEEGIKWFPDVARYENRSPIPGFTEIFVPDPKTTVWFPHVLPCPPPGFHNPGFP